MATAGDIPSSTGVIVTSVRYPYIFVTYLSSQRWPTPAYPCVVIVCIECYIRPFVQQYPHSSSSPYHSAGNAYRIACYIPPFVQQYSADFPCILLLTLPHSDSFTPARCAILPPHYLYNDPTRHSYPSPPSAVIQQSARLLKVPPHLIRTAVLCTLPISSSSLHHSTVFAHCIACYIHPFVRQYSACSLHGSYRLLLPSIRTAVLSRTATLTQQPCSLHKHSLATLPYLPAYITHSPFFFFVAKYGCIVACFVTDLF